MEVFSLCLVAITTVLVLWLLNIAASYGGNSPAQNQKRLPPGPWRLPIIGSLHHVVSVLPHRRLMEMSRRHGPLMLLMLGEIPTIVVSNAEAAALVMKTNDLSFASRPSSTTLDIVSCGGKGIAFAPYGEHWRQMRKICTVELLSAKQVKRMESIRAEMVAGLLRSIGTAALVGAVNISAKVALFTNDIGSRVVFGGRCARQAEYLRELDKVVTLVGGFCLHDLFPSSRLVRWLSNSERNVRRSYGHIDCIISDIIEGRKVVRAAIDRLCSTDEDLLDVLLRLQEENSLAFPLTTEIIGVTIFDMFGAATETTSTALEWAMSELINNPEVMAKVQKEVRDVLGQDRVVITNSDLNDLGYMRMVIKEVLRLHPPFPLLLPRETREDSEIMGYHIPKGTNIYVNAFAISRDPKYWDNPAEFRPERFVNSSMNYEGTYFEFTPFGSGRRICPGMLFATSTMEIALANLLYHFNWQLPGGDHVDMSEKFGLTVGRKFDLQLVAIPHSGNKVMAL
ncbi:hypothetical protein QYE76_029054 [Lolium multiflorum]|uniref:Cytochrome P450 71D7 n=1 Tax=Lolium multiflorum TaxID=4521 RepID=A0AAD8QNG6_LOLMU|nr:hypothetical protein QYE76_029054 [Lolium multiflorum]